MATFLLSKSTNVVLSHAPRLRTVTKLKAESSLPKPAYLAGPTNHNHSNSHTPDGRRLLLALRSLRVWVARKATYNQSFSLRARAIFTIAILREISNVTSYLEVR